MLYQKHYRSERVPSGSLYRSYRGFCRCTGKQKKDIYSNKTIQLCIKDSRKEAIKAAPIIEGEYIHYYDEKQGKIMKEKLSNLKD